MGLEEEREPRRNASETLDSTSLSAGGDAPQVGGQRPRVLVVDDDEHLLMTLHRGLSLRGFDVGLASRSNQALVYLQGGWPDVMILDVMMPGMDGLSLCRLVRDSSDLPILMLTALDSVPDRVAGLEAGCDDYLVKPFALDELVARLQALLRRSRFHVSKGEALSYADLTLDRKSWAASRGGRPLSLTATEFRLLEHFMRHPEEVLDRDEIMTALWGEDSPVESNVVDVHVANLRQRLEENGEPRLIQTVRGVGYTLKSGE
jgi:two-component system response regulator MprA